MHLGKAHIFMSALNIGVDSFVLSYKLSLPSIVWFMFWIYVKLRQLRKRFVQSIGSRKNLLQWLIRNILSHFT